MLSCLREAAEKSWEGAELKQKSTVSHILEETSNPKPGPGCPLLICPSERMGFFFSQRFPSWRRLFLLLEQQTLEESGLSWMKAVMHRTQSAAHIFSIPREPGLG